MARQIPSVGRVVHYVTHDGIHCAADIVDVHPEQEVVDLFVKFPPAANNGAFAGRGAVRYSRDAEPETWHWPEPVKPVDDPA